MGDMILGRLLSRKKHGVLVVRIGKQTVDFVFFAHEASAPEIIAWGSEDISYMNVRDTLEKIFARLPNKESLQELVATFEASMFRASVTQLSVPLAATPHIITRTEALAMEREAQDRATRHMQDTVLKESGIVPHEFALRRVRILERKIAGYRVARLEGFERRPIELSILALFLLEKQFKPLDQFVKTHRIRKVQVLHIAEALEMFAQRHGREGVYLCVEEEKTQIAVRQRERFLFPGAIPMGDERFQEIVGHVLGMSPHAAAVLRRRYFQGALSKAAKKKLTSFLLPDIQKFAMLIQAKLQELQIVLPSRLWLFGRVHAFAYAQELFAGDEELKTEFLLPRDVWEISTNSLAQDPLYTPLCLLGAARAQFSQSNEKTTY